MKTPIKRLGVIVGVNGNESEVGMYSMSNDANFLWYGKLLAGPKVGATLTINQNNIKIIASVGTEKIIDQQNSIRSVEFDNRYSKNSINRIVTLKTKGVIHDDEFEVTSAYVPMVGNEVTLTTQEDLDLIYGINRNEDTVKLGTSVFEKQPVKLSINSFFASHIGIFGNTGSGKSNTLHKLYLELFQSKFRNNILESSQFFVIDFNGEYTGDEMFGVGKEYKEIFDINTRNNAVGDKITIKRSYLFDADILAILFDAKPATQVPFLRNALRMYKDRVKSADEFAKLEIGLIIKILKGMKKVASDAKDNWIDAARSVGITEEYFIPLKELTKNLYGDEYWSSGEKLKVDSNPSQAFLNNLNIPELEYELSEKFEQANEIQKLQYFLEFQKVFVSAWNSTNIDYIKPLFQRINSAFASLSKVIEVQKSIKNEFKSLNIISLVNANQEITRLLPMLISKMIYDEQKATASGGKVTQTKHLIIDEAHNILNGQMRNNGDDWQDFRLSVFEEIIKEGRKFGFFLTLASQRPSDISSTIISQIHNFLIHRIVNEKDLKMLENTMPTLDSFSEHLIPSLGKGEVIVTGVATPVPVIVKVPKEEKIRPQSDDVILTKLWSKNVDND